MTPILFDIDRIHIIARKHEYRDFHFENGKRPYSGFVYFEEGEGTVSVTGEGTFPVRRGDAVLLWAGEAYRFDFSERCTYITSALDFSADVLPLLPMFPRVVCCLPQEQSLFDKVEKKWATQSEDSFMSCKIDLLRLYLDILSRLGKEHSGTDALIVQALDYLHKQYKKDFSVAKLAEACAVSPSGLRCRFKTAVGCGILAYREKLRMKTAVSMLSCGLFTVKEIAEELGYCDVAHFSKSFRCAMGCYPGAYVKTVAKTADSPPDNK